MTRRMMFLLGVATLLTFTAGGVWAGWAWANTHGSTTATTVSAPTAAKTSGCCCDDPTCPPGCTPECAAECLPAAKTIEVKAKKGCPPCPFCP